MSQTENVTTLKLRGSHRAHKQWQKTNGMKKCVFLLKNIMIFFRIVTLILFKNIFRNTTACQTTFINYAEQLQ
jgi:hypothetical protein